MFELKSYEREIRNYMNTNKVDAAESLNRFIFNLRVLRDHYEGFGPDINFRDVGQQWNKLTSDTRNAQKTSMLKILSRPRTSSMEV